MKAPNASSAATFVSAIQISCNARLAFGCWPGRHGEPTALQIKQQTAPVMRAFAGAIGEADQFLAAFRRRTDQHQDALLFVLEPRLEMDAIGPDVNVALRRQITSLPRGVFVDPTVLQPTDGGCRQPGSILAEQRR